MYRRVVSLHAGVQMTAIGYRLVLSNSQIFEDMIQNEFNLKNQCALRLRVNKIQSDIDIY
jgi:hypothetical protein